MTLTIKNVSDFWAATGEKQLKVKTCSGIWVAKLESSMKNDKLSGRYLQCVVQSKPGLVETLWTSWGAAFNSDDSDVFQDLIIVFLDW